MQFFRFDDWVVSAEQISLICLQATPDPPRPEQTIRDVVIFLKSGQHLRLTGVSAEAGRQWIKEWEAVKDLTPTPPTPVPAAGRPN